MKATKPATTNTLKVKMLTDVAVMPTYATDGAACFDISATDTVGIPAGRAATISTGIAVEVPQGYVMMLYSRSGHGYKHCLRLSNCVGVIDSDYRGEVCVRLHNDGKETYIVQQGERIAQAMIVPAPQFALEKVAELSDTARGTGGFGSTGK